MNDDTLINLVARGLVDKVIYLISILVHNSKSEMKSEYYLISLKSVLWKT